MAEMPVLQEQKPALRPIARNLSSRSSFALYSTYFLIHRHCRRPRIVRRVVRHDPRPVHPGGPVNAASFRRAIGAVKTAAAPPAGLCKPLSVLGSALGVPGILLQHSRTP